MFEEAAAVGDEAAEVPVEDWCQVRDSNISKSIGNVLDYYFQMFRMQIYIILLAFVVSLWPWSVLQHYDVDLPPSPRFFDKNYAILGFEFTFSIFLITFWESGVQTERHRVPWLGQIE